MKTMKRPRLATIALTPMSVLKELLTVSTIAQTKSETTAAVAIQDINSTATNSAAEMLMNVRINFTAVIKCASMLLDVIRVHANLDTIWTGIIRVKRIILQ